jgi:uncharacterized protein
VRLLRRLLTGALITFGIGCVAVPVIIAEAALHGHRPAPYPSEAASLAARTQSAWEPASVTTPDGAVLSAWLFTPQLSNEESNGGAVILLHGVNDNRTGMMSHAEYLLRAGYTVLAPDSRDHGASSGGFMTYGIREADDVHAWAEFLFEHSHVKRLYGLGESMGAAILIQSLPREPRFRAVVAESPFATFEEVAQYRLRYYSHLGAWASWPTAQIGFVYARARYGVNLKQASPAAAISKSSIPVLLIHGTADWRIPLRHSLELHSASPGTSTLWIVDGAAHTGAHNHDPAEYEKRLLTWFASH